MTICSAGYVLVAESVRPDYMDSRLIPETVLSISTCICEHHPNIDVLWGMSTQAKATYEHELKLNQQGSTELMAWIDTYHESGQLGYPQTFQSLDLAHTFKRQFLSHVAVKVVGLALPEAHISTFLEDSEMGESPERYGIERFVMRRENVETGHLLGYEVLGYEKGIFHSYLCNGLESEFAEQFPFRLNEHGLIPTLEEAERYCTYSNQEDVETESVLWLPWAIFEVDV